MEAWAPSHRIIHNTLEFGFIDEYETQFPCNKDYDDENLDYLENMFLCILVGYVRTWTRKRKKGNKISFYSWKDMAPLVVAVLARYHREKPMNEINIDIFFLVTKLISILRMRSNTKTPHQLKIVALVNFSAKNWLLISLQLTKFLKV